MASRFITFEGLDGSGKSTHLRRAEEWLRIRGIAVRSTHEPGGTDLGDAIRGVFLDRQWRSIDGRVEAMMVFASRRQHLLEIIEPALARGEHVLCDRFTDSTYAYQGSGRGLSSDWIDGLDRLATDRRQPDLTLYFDLTAEEAFERGRSSRLRKKPERVDRLDAEDLEFYRRVRAGYGARMAADPARFRRVDSSGERQATWDQVREILRRELEIEG